MSFKRWFKWWLRSFSAIMFHGQVKHKSEAQREREKQKRREYKRRRHKMKYTVKKRKKARSSNAILLDKVGNFLVASIAFLLVPFGLLKRAKRGKSIGKAKVKSGKHSSFKASTVTSPKKEENKPEEVKEKNTEVKKTVTPSAKSFFNNSAIQRKTTERKPVEKKEEKKKRRKEGYFGNQRARRGAQNGEKGRKCTQIHFFVRKGHPLPQAPDSSNCRR